MLRGAGLLLLIVALAGPRWPDLRTRITTEGIAVMLVVDVSGSMAERDFDWQGEAVSRLDALKRVLGLFVAGGAGPEGESFEGRPHDLIGLVTFATRPESVCPLTLSHSAVLRLLDAEQPRSVPTESETNLGDALAWGLHRLDSAGPRRRVIVLISDGEHNVPPPALTPRQAGQLAANLHVPVYTIDTGGTAAEEQPDAGRALGERALQAVAQLTSAQAFRADDTRGLLAASQEIDRLERQEITSYQYRRYYEGYAWFGLASLVFLVVAQVLDRTVWQRIP
jgi:Ca-activated chloride channel family protein